MGRGVRLHRCRQAAIGVGGRTGASRLIGRSSATRSPLRTRRWHFARSAAYLRCAARLLALGRSIVAIACLGAWTGMVARQTGSPAAGGTQGCTRRRVAVAARPTGAAPAPRPSLRRAHCGEGSGVSLRALKAANPAGVRSSVGEPSFREAQEQLVPIRGYRVPAAGTQLEKLSRPGVEVVEEEGSSGKESARSQTAGELVEGLAGLSSMCRPL